MTDPKKSQEAAIYGALLSDAAANPWNWVYNGDRIKELFETHEKPEFSSEWACPFYKTNVGSLSSYGEQVYCLLKSLCDNNGFDVKKYAKDQYNWFSKFQPNPTNKEGYPKQGTWINGNVGRSLEKLKDENILAGSDEAEADAFSKIIPLVALYAGKTDLNDVVEKAVRTTLNNDKSVETAIAYAKLLETCILTGDYNIEEWCKQLPESEVKKEIEDVIKSKEEDHIAAVKKFGIACALPGSFQGAIHCLLKCNAGFVEGVRLAMSPGGGSCGRCIAVGAVLAAKHGILSIPNEWLKMTLAGEDIMKCIDQICKIRK